MSAFGFLKPLDFIVVTHAIEENKVEENYWEKTTVTLKQHISKENT